MGVTRYRGVVPFAAAISQDLRTAYDLFFSFLWDQRILDFFVLPIFFIL